MDQDHTLYDALVATGQTGIDRVRDEANEGITSLYRIITATISENTERLTDSFFDTVANMAMSISETFRNVETFQDFLDLTRNTLSGTLQQGRNLVNLALPGIEG